MKDYLADFLTLGGSENLKTSTGSKAQKVQKSPATFESTQRGQVSKVSKAPFDTFDTSPPWEYPKIQAPSAIEPEAARERAPLGSLAKPVVCRGDRMPAGCPWHTCGGDLARMGDYYQCQTCSTWFELKSANFGVYVGDLADDIDANVTEWTMGTDAAAPENAATAV